MRLEDLTYKQLQDSALREQILDEYKSTLVVERSDDGDTFVEIRIGRLSLEELAKKLPEKKLSADEREEMLVSFIYGMLPQELTASKEEIRQVLKLGEKKNAPSVTLTPEHERQMEEASLEGHSWNLPYARDEDPLSSEAMEEFIGRITK
jgi:hypothetical protein